MGVEKRFLDQVSRIDLALQAPADLQAGQEREVALILFQELSECHHASLLELSNRLGGNVESIDAPLNEALRDSHLLTLWRG